MDNDFTSDFICWLPLWDMCLDKKFHKFTKVLFFIKCYRMVKAMRIFDVSKIMSKIEKLWMQRNLDQTKKDITRDYEKTIDFNKIQTLILIGYILKTAKLVIHIINISYFLGMIWWVYQEIINEYVTEGSFYHEFELYKWDMETEQMLVVLYFAFTTMSTVGFGDYYPSSDQERLVGCILLVFGVAIFSYIMGNFIEMLEALRLVNEEQDDSYNLDKFLDMLKMFNDNKPIKHEFVTKLRDYFHYRWNKDKNLGLLDA